MSASPAENVPSSLEQTPSGTRSLSMDTALGQVMLDDTNRDPLAGIEARANEPIVVEIRPIPGMPNGCFNAAAWEDDGCTYLLARHVDEAGKPGDGDPGSIILLTLKSNAVVATKTLWNPASPDQKADRLEDARAVTTADGDLVIKLTRLAIGSSGRYAPFPAAVTTTTNALLHGDFPPTYHMEGLGDTILGDQEQFYVLEGKNATPIDNPSGEQHFMVRAEVHNHTFVVYSVDGNHYATRRQHLEIPKDRIPEWGSRRMGTTMPPVWIDGKEAVLFVHGLQMVDGKPRYTIGTARLLYTNGKYTIDNVSTDPVLTPEDLAALYPGEQVQLHPEERVAMYMCGGVVKRDQDGKPIQIDGFPSVGDSRTVRATFDVGAITARWTMPEELAA